MADFKRTYRTGRSLLLVLASIAWGIAALGVAVVLVAFISLWRSAAGPTGDEPKTIAAGLLLLLGGLCAVGIFQAVRATFDTADMTREMLQIARRTAPARTAPAMIPDHTRTEPRLTGTPPEPSPSRAPRPHPLFRARPPR